MAKNKNIAHSSICLKANDIQAKHEYRCKVLLLRLKSSIPALYCEMHQIKLHTTCCTKIPFLSIQCRNSFLVRLLFWFVELWFFMNPGLHFLTKALLIFSVFLYWVLRYGCKNTKRFSNLSPIWDAQQIWINFCLFFKPAYIYRLFDSFCTFMANNMEKSSIE